MDINQQVILSAALSAMIYVQTNSVYAVKVKVARDRPRWPKVFR